MVSTRALIYKSSCHLVNVPSALITIGITVTLMFHSFFQFSSKVQVFISLFAFFQFYPEVSRNGKVCYSVGFLFLLLTITKSGRLAEIRGSVCISNPRKFCASQSLRRILAVPISFVSMVKFQLPVQFPVDHLLHPVVIIIIIIIIILIIIDK